MSNFAGGDVNEAPAPSQPALCANNCGFFANVGTLGMCSKCYREQQAALEKSKPASEALASAAAAAAGVQAEAAGPSTPEEPSPAEQPAVAVPSPEAAPISPEPPVSKGPSRCQSCRKKVGLTGFKCKCGLMFCGQHRYAEAHGCTFDYKTAERQKLAENNPLVQASKVDRI